MGYLFLSILSSSLIAVIFKFLERYNLKLMPVIVINYFFAVFWGFLLNDNDLSASTFQEPWVPVTFIIGIALLIMFNVIGYSTQKIGIAVTTISKEMSVVLPISFSIFFYNEELNSMKEIGIFMAVTAVFLSVYKKRKKEFETQYIFLPVLLVFGIGFIDSILKFSLEEYNAKDSVSIFSAFSFAIAGIIGIGVSLINKIPIKQFVEKKALIIGGLLGTANFGSMYFLMYALAHAKIDSSAVYAINNTGIIVFSVLAAIFMFKEKISIINRIGILLSIVAIIILTGAINLIKY